MWCSYWRVSVCGNLGTDGKMILGNGGGGSNGRILCNRSSCLLSTRPESQMYVCHLLAGFLDVMGLSGITETRLDSCSRSSVTGGCFFFLASPLLWPPCSISIPYLWNNLSLPSSWQYSSLLVFLVSSSQLFRALYTSLSLSPKKEKGWTRCCQAKPSLPSVFGKLPPGIQLLKCRNWIIFVELLSMLRMSQQDDVEKQRSLVMQNFPSCLLEGGGHCSVAPIHSWIPSLIHWTKR